MASLSYLEEQVKELEARLEVLKVSRDMAKAREEGGDTTYAYVATWHAGWQSPVIKYVKGKRYMSDATGVFILLLENDPLERVVNVLEASESLEDDSATGYHATRHEALVALGRRLTDESQKLAVRKAALEVRQAELAEQLQSMPTDAEQVDCVPER